jgi:hypothetical protein
MREKAENIKKLVRDLSEFSEVAILEDRAIISLISNIDKAAEVLATTFTVMDRYLLLKNISYYYCPSINDYNAICCLVV